MPTSELAGTRANSGFERDGAQRFRGRALDCLDALERALAPIVAHPGGTRLFDCPAIAILADDAPLGSLAADLLGGPARPVRAILFDKNRAANWSLGWHQDRVIAVRSKIEVAGFGPWSVKRGVAHVAPPWELLRAMVTLRVHLDDVGVDRAPLRVAPGTHRLGIISSDKVAAVVARYGAVTCLANSGDVWAYSTPLLHASSASVSATRRRVLHLDYARFDLPGGLQWRGL